MASSTITIQVTGTPSVDDRINLNRLPPELGGGWGIYSIFKNPRSGYREISINADIATQVINIKNAFDIDYGAYGEYETTITAFDTIQIKRIDQVGYFDEAEIVGTWGTITSIVNDDPTGSITVTNEQYLTHGVDNCGKALLEITTNKQASAININGVTTSVTTNPFTVEVFRGNAGNYTVYYASESKTNTYQAPNKWFFTTVTQNYVPGGYIVKINTDDNSNLIDNISYLLTYSKDGVNYQAYSSFSNLTPGTYTFYVKDPYGCIKTKIYEVVDDQQVTNVPDSFEIPEANSIHFALQQPGARKNYKNTLSYEEEGYNSCDFRQIFVTTENETIQFRTPRTDNTMVAIDKDGNEISIPIDKKTTNINQFDSRDAILYKFDDDFVGIYMNGGNVYDSTTVNTTQTVIDDNLVFKDVPNFYKVGNYVTIGLVGTYQITGFFQVAEIGARVAKLSYREPDLADFDEIATINFNYQEYEIYEAFIDTSILSGCYQFKLETSNGLITETYLSEVCEFFDEAPEKTNEYRYYNDDNNQINYQTGITHHLILPYIDITRDEGESANEVIRIDTNITNTEGVVTDVERFTASRIPKSMLRKIRRMEVSKFVEINGIAYSDLKIEQEPLGATNLYDLTILATPSGEQFTSNSGRRAVVNIDTAGVIQIAEGQGFIKHGN